jgi:antibiotic biosynthesis monooxygenase (ABM) superfamily enzyme
MIDHIVLLQPKPEKTEEEINTILSHVRDLQQQIPGIIETQAGKNLSANQQGYTYGFVMRFVDKEHLKAYAPHPAHQVVSKELRDMCQSIIDFDSEVNS